MLQDEKKKTKKYVIITCSFSSYDTLCVCACVRACVRARACVRVCVCVYLCV